MKFISLLPTLMEYWSSPLVMKILRKPFKEREGALNPTLFLVSKSGGPLAGLSIHYPIDFWFNYSISYPINSCGLNHGVTI